MIVNVINVLLVIPSTPLMILMNKISSSYWMMILIFVTFGWSGTARVIRAQVLAIKNMNYVKYCEIAGANKLYIIKTHLLPAVVNLLIMNCCLSCAGFMIAEAGMSFIGLGDPTTISWGKMLVKAQESAFSSRMWAWIIAPGVMIFIIVTGLMQIGYALEDILNPKMSLEDNEIKAFKKLDNKTVDDFFDKMDEKIDESGYGEYYE